MLPNYQAVFFDLDGTLCDTALDFTHAINAVLREEKRATLSLTQVRQTVSNGAMAVTRLGFADIQDEDSLLQLRNRMVDHYYTHIVTHTQLYPGMQAILSHLVRLEKAWGVVTNKPEALSRKLLDGLHLITPPSVIVGGDTLTVAKPNPEPLWHAAEVCGVHPALCIYVGDHPRDVEAAKAAGMLSIAASYGYLSHDDHASNWGADLVIDTPHELAAVLGLLA